MNNKHRKILAFVAVCVMGYSMGSIVGHAYLGNLWLALGYIVAFALSAAACHLFIYQVQRHFMDEIVDDMKSTGALDIVLKNAKYMEQRPRHATPVVRSPGRVSGKTIPIPDDYEWKTPETISGGDYKE